MFPKKIFTGIEFGNNCIKIIESAKIKHNYIISNFINANVADLDFNDVGSVSANLKNLISENKISKKNTFANIPDLFVTAYNFILPEMPLPDLRASVEYELKKVIPFPISTSIHDFIYVKKIDENNNSNLYLTAFVAKNDDVKKFNEIFIRAGIKLKSIECKAVSMYNNILFMMENKIEKHLLLCDILENTAKIIIIKDNFINFERLIDGVNFKNLDWKQGSELIGDELKKTIDYYFAGRSLPSLDGIIITGIFPAKSEFNKKIMDMTNIETHSISIISLLKEKKLLYLSERFSQHSIEEASDTQSPEYNFFKPIEEMWTTLGLVINR